MSDDENIIHVSFGPGGGKRRTPRGSASPQPAAARGRARSKEPIFDLYTVRDASKLFGISTSRLRYWERTGFIARSGTVGQRRFYTFQDLIGIRAAKGLLDNGIALRSVRRGIEALRETLPKVARPLSSLRVFTDGQNLVVKDGEGTFEPVTGQLVLDFEVSSLRDDVVRVLSRNGWASNQRAAYEYYLEGCRYDENEKTMNEAEAAYYRAIELDPSFANAFTNLGNLLFRRGDVEVAEQMYRRALQIDPDQPEAYYNLGFLFYERGDLQKARMNFERAVGCEPAFADAHFNLAMVLEELDRDQEARKHWETYLELEPNTSWAEIARRHLGEE